MDPSKFDMLATQILNNSILIANKKTFRICEIEFYLYCDGHRDEYSHRNPDQLLFEMFYFHRFKNGTFKAGTFKGLDISLGDFERNTFFGILIRSLLDLDTLEFIEGSCNCVNAILHEFNVNTVKELFHQYYPTINQIPIDDQKLQLRNFALKKSNSDINNYFLEKFDIFKAPRIGLSNKYLEYKNKYYRYAILLNKIKKQKRSFIKSVTKI